MPNNRKSGGAYDYVSEREWLKADNYDVTALIEQHIKKWEAK